MRKLIAAINMSLDGICDHTSMIADDEVHQHYTDLIKDSGTLLYGRVTYQLMENYWPMVVKEPTGNKQTDDFAVAIDNVPKIVYSRTLKSVGWKNTLLKGDINREDILALKQQDGKSILAGSPGLIVALSQLGLIDEYQLNIQPTILGRGLSLFKNIRDRIDLKLIKTKPFGCGSLLLYHEVVRK
jgi:dihydrofolate reductase